MAKKPVPQKYPFPVVKQGDGRFPRQGGLLTASYVESLERRIMALESQTKFGVGGVSGRGMSTPITPGFTQTIKFAVAAPETNDPFKAYPLEFIVNPSHDEKRDQRLFGHWSSMEDHGGDGSHLAIRLNFCLWDSGNSVSGNPAGSYAGNWMQAIIDSENGIRSFFPVKNEIFAYVQGAPSLLLAIPFALARSGVLIQDGANASLFKAKTVSAGYTTYWSAVDSTDYPLAGNLYDGQNIKAIYNVQTRKMEIVSAACISYLE